MRIPPVAWHRWQEGHSDFNIPAPIILKSSVWGQTCSSYGKEGLLGKNCVSVDLFISEHWVCDGVMAERVECWTCDQQVVGSNLSRGKAT